MRYVILAAALILACGCPKKNVEGEKKIEDAAQVAEDGGGEDHVVMDALVIDGSLPD